jgi:hypothetical protein
MLTTKGHEHFYQCLAFRGHSIHIWETCYVLEILCFVLGNFNTNLRISVSFIVFTTITHICCYSEKYNFTKGRHDLFTIIDNLWMLWLWCLTPLWTLFHLCRGSLFYWWRNESTRTKSPTSHKSLTNFIT